MMRNKFVTINGMSVGIYNSIVFMYLKSWSFQDVEVIQIWNKNEEK